MPELARRIGRAKPSAIMVVAEKAKRLKSEGRDIISFSIGVPNFLPGDHVYAAAREALAKDSGQYGSNRGSDALLDAFLAHIAQIGLNGYERANIATGIGAKHVIFNLAEALLDEGDTICFAVPYWTSYVDIAEIVNAKIELLPCPASQDYKMTPAQLDAALAKKPKVFLFNNPSNPTGMVYSKDEISALADVIAKYPDTWVITDDIYNRMVFDGLGYHNFVHARPELRDRVIFLDSLSKTYGMPGWRVGFLAGPEKRREGDRDDELQPHHQHPGSRDRRGDRRAVRPAGRSRNRRTPSSPAKRDQVLAMLATLPGVVCPRPQGAFYVFPDISVAFGKTHGPTGQKIANDVDFCNALLDAKGVACVPGSAFGEPRALRISYTCPTPQLAPGLQRFKRVL